MSFPKASKADIALLLEGTFPYVSGGVSSWVNQIIRAFPQYSFALVFLGSRRSDYGEPKYALPDNVVHLETHYLHEHWGKVEEIKPMTGDAKVFGAIRDLHTKFKELSNIPASMEAFKGIVPELISGNRLSLDQFLHSEESWRFITEQYKSYCIDPSFVDYFWTVRIMHQPLWQLAAIAKELIPVNCLHTISTGYAGFLGAMIKSLNGAPLILSEHGIYTKERKIDLYQNQYIRDNRNIFQKDPTELSYFRQMWINFFEWLGRLCYAAADPIISLYEANRLRQITDGAPAEKTFCIPNGVNLKRLAPLREKRNKTPPPVLCLIGRVVPIKDIKTFIRAMRSVVNQMPDAEGWIAGPEDEDPGYAEECRNLVESLGLQDKVKFLGFQKIDELMPKIGLIILSSISEALPLVILEGYAAGVPCVSTDVGSCRQLIEGLSDEDKALGSAGGVVRIADPQALAEVSVSLLSNEENWYEAQLAGIRRVEKFYVDEMMFNQYQEVYESALASHRT